MCEHKFIMKIIWHVKKEVNGKCETCFKSKRKLILEKKPPNNPSPLKKKKKTAKKNWKSFFYVNQNWKIWNAKKGWILFDKQSIGSISVQRFQRGKITGNFLKSRGACQWLLQKLWRSVNQSLKFATRIRNKGGERSFLIFLEINTIIFCRNINFFLFFVLILLVCLHLLDREFWLNMKFPLLEVKKSWIYCMIFMIAISTL